MVEREEDEEDEVTHEVLGRRSGVSVLMDSEVGSIARGLKHNSTLKQLVIEGKPYCSRFRVKKGEEAEEDKRQDGREEEDNKEQNTISYS